MDRLSAYFLVVPIGLALAGCAGSGASSKGASTDASGSSTGFGASSQWRRADPAVVQRDVMNFADRFAGRMADTYDGLAATAASPEAKNAALERKIGNVSAAYVNACGPSAYVGLIDMIVTVTLVRQASQEPWFTELFGEADAAKVVAVLEAQEADVWNVGSRYLTEGQLAELREAIDRWHRDHPGQRYVSTVRLADFPEAKSPPPADAKGQPTSVFGLLFIDPLAGLDPTKREVVRARESAERMFFYAQRMPILLSWQSEALSRRVLELPPVQKFVGSTTYFGAFADSTRSLADSLKRLPQTIADERKGAVTLLAQTVAAERDAALRQSGQVVAEQRDAAIKQFAQVVSAERVEVTRSTTQAIASERDAIVSAWNASLETQRQALMRDMETASSRAVNRVSLLGGLLVSLGIMLTALAVLIVRRTAPPARAADYKPLRGYIVETGETEDEIRITRSV